MAANTYPQYSTRYPLLLTDFMHRPVSLYPDDIGVVYRNDAGEYYRFTWRQWYRRTCQLAHALKQLGIKPGKPGEPGDRIGAMALNHHRHLELIYAGTCLGAVSHPINVMLSREHMIHTINHAGDAIIFVDEAIMPLLELIYDRIKDTVKAFVYISDRPGKPQTRISPLYEYEELLKGQPEEFDWPFLSEDTYAVLYYTTGTTGVPKGVMFTHRQLYLQTVNILAASMMRFHAFALEFLEWLFTAKAEAIGKVIAAGGGASQILEELKKDFPMYDVPLVNIPLFHIHAWGAPWQNVLSANKIVFPGRFSPRAFCEIVQTERVTSTGLVPTMLAMLLEFEDLNKYDLSSLRAIGVGGAALPLGLKAKAEKQFPTFRVSSGYGMTETAAGSIAATLKRHMITWPKEKQDQVRVKTGLPIFGIQAKVIGEDGKPVPQDNATLGEIVLRGHWIMEQYYKDPEKTETAWRDGWFHTGDMAKVDEEGYIVIADRITDVIRSGAEMVPTVLLENLTATCDHVLEATFVGVPDEKWGERPMALVKPVPGAQVTEEDIYHFLEVEGVEKGKITKWMLPDFIAFCDNIPKTSVGKYDKITIRKRLDEFLAKAKRMRAPK
jgi:acyl-CoA synthetase (AMP-forming)/AMP-acid ligase II